MHANVEEICVRTLLTKMFKMYSRTIIKFLTTEGKRPKEEK